MTVPARWEPRFFEVDPRFAPIARAARAFAGEPDFPPVGRWNAALDAAGFWVPVTFVPQRAPLRRAGGERAPYDREVAREGRVPSREKSWHDFLNMLMWAAFPRTKKAIHDRQLEAADTRERPDEGNNRGPERDGLAMLDEGGVLVAVRARYEASLAGALAGDAERFAALCTEGACTPFLIGHAIYERLVVADAHPLFAAALPFVVASTEAGVVDAAVGDRVAHPACICTP